MFDPLNVAVEYAPDVVVGLDAVERGDRQPEVDGRRDESGLEYLDAVAADAVGERAGARGDALADFVGERVASRRRCSAANGGRRRLSRRRGRRSPATP